MPTSVGGVKKIFRKVGKNKGGQLQADVRL
jgi:hypothetical protein